MRYYEMVGHRVTVSNTVYKTVSKPFITQWARYKDQKQQMQPVALKITGELPVMQWAGVFNDFLHRKIGVRTIPLSYVTRATALASRPSSDHKDDLPYGEEFDSIEEELVTQASHMHPLYCEDNAIVYYCLEEAVRGTQYALSFKPYQQVKMEGRLWSPLHSSLLELTNGKQNYTQGISFCMKRCGMVRHYTP
eukprot:11812456-Ditylum_brightwellii.AAC.1